MTAGVHCEHFPVCMVVGIDASIPVCEETECPGRARQHVARTIAAGLLEPRTNAEVRAAIDGVLALKEQRNTTIEACARVVEREAYDHDDMVRIAAAIRALKDKP